MDQFAITPNLLTPKTNGSNEIDDGEMQRIPNRNLLHQFY